MKKYEKIIVNLPADADKGHVKERFDNIIQLALWKRKTNLREYLAAIPQ